MVLWNTPDLTHVRRVRQALVPRVASARDIACRFLISELVVICDQMGTSKSRRPIVGDF